MDLKIRNLNVDGYRKEFSKLIGTYEFEGLHTDVLEDMYLTIKVYESSNGEFTAKSNLGVRDNAGDILYPDMCAPTEEKAITDTLCRFKSLVLDSYPNIIPEHAIYYRDLENYEYEKSVNERFPKENFNDDWRYDKLKFNCKGGPYLEFQLENDGSYTHWNKDSIFIGNTVFDPVYEVFCRKPNDFDTWGVNLFTIFELPKLKVNINNKIELLKSIKSLSEYVEKVAPIQHWCHESGKSIWKELRDAIIDFLIAALDMVEDGIGNKKSLFVIGV